jgi:hypothetical protein
MEQNAGRPEAAQPRVVDCHNHVGWHGHDADDVVRNMDEFGIALTWVLTWEAPPREISPGSLKAIKSERGCLGVEDVLEAAARHPDRLVPFYAPDPREPDALERLQNAVERSGVRGFGELKCQVMLDNPWLLRLFHYCGETGLPVIFHVDVPLPRHDLARDPGYWYCCDWENLARALELCPSTVLIGHGPGFWREISGDADSCPDAYPRGPIAAGGRIRKFLDAYANLRCDLSAGSALNALSRDPAAGRAFLLDYQDRCLFGRDAFDDRMRQFIKSCRLPLAAETAIMGKNALRLVPAAV